MNSDVIAIRPETLRQGHLSLAMQFHIKNALTTITVKVAMLAHIRTEARRPPLDRYLPRQAALHQRIQTIINGGHRNLRHLPLGPNENFLGCRVITLLQKHRINVLALRGKPKTAS